MNSDPPRLLLDTHYWIWLQAGAREEFSHTVRKAVDEAAASGNLLHSSRAPACNQIQ
jgi:PIN domain nuclease of toxin-antitoxin system